MANKISTQTKDIIKFIKSNEGVTVAEVAEHFNITTASIYTIRHTHALHGYMTAEKSGPKGNGIMGIEAKEIEMRDASKQELSRIETLLEQNGYRPQWSVSWVHLMDGDTKTTTLLRNPHEVEQEEQWREEFIERIKKHSPKVQKPKRKKVTDGHMQLIDIADLHIGKAAYGHDGEELYSIEKAVEIAHKAVESLVAHGSCYSPEQFILPIGNDILHIDSKANTTTKGTAQDTDKMWTHMVDAAFHLYVTIAQDLATIAPVKLIHCRDNHAEHLSYMLAKQVEAYLHNNANITSDISRLDRMYHVYGKNLIGLDHGHGVAANKLQEVVSAEQRRLWGEADHVTFVRHHIHHAVTQKKGVKVMSEEVLKDYAGMTVMYMRTPSGTDDYHHNAGYVGGRKAIDSIIFHPERGQIAHLSCPV